jgi:hypothetical protein
VTAERFPKGGALLLGLMGAIGNLSISQTLPLMGGIYDSYTVQAIPSDMQGAKVKAPDGRELDLVIGESASEARSESWVPRVIAELIYPSGSRKLNPEAVNALEKRKDGDKEAAQKDQIIRNAEKNGAAWAFRWVSVLPCILVVVFGLIALTDRLRGGYKAVHISEGKT